MSKIVLISCVMALAALEKLAQEVSTPPPRPAALDVASSDDLAIAMFSKLVAEFEENVRQRVATSIVTRIEMERSLRRPDVIAQADEHPTVVRRVSEVIAQIDEIIVREKGRLSDAMKETDRRIADSSRLNASGTKVLRKLQKRVLKAHMSFINSMVDLYYFLLALRSEFDPESRGGQSFSDPEELARYLREQVG
jgi:hypothetical protein